MKIAYLIALGFAAPATAAITWDGGDPVNNNWSDNDNWNSAYVAGEEIIFPSGIPAGDKSTVNDFIGTFVQNLTFNDIGYSVTGNSLIISGSAASRFITLTAGIGTTTIGVPVALTNDATFSSTGSRATLLFTGPINIGSKTLTIGNSNGFVNFNGNITGTGKLVKTGIGTTTIAATSTVTVGQGISVDQGKLIINGSGSATTVAAGARLGGTGTLTHGEILGTLEPGGSSLPDYGTMNFSTLTFAAGSTFAPEIELGNSDKAVSNGATVIAATATLSPQIPESIPFPIGSTYTLLEKTPAGAIGSQFSNTGEGAVIPNGRTTYSLTYLGGNGNDLQLTILAISASGITRTWDGGGGDNLWSNPLNWSGDILPGGGDALLFPAGAPRPVSINDLPPYFAISDITIQSGAYQFSGNAITLSGSLNTSNTDSDLTFSLPLATSNYPGFAGTVFSHTGTRALNLDSTIANPSVSPARVTIVNDAPSGPGLRFRGFVQSSSFSELSLLNRSTTPLETIAALSFDCGTLSCLGGNIKISGPRTINAQTTRIGSEAIGILTPAQPSHLTIDGNSLVSLASLSSVEISIASDSSLLANASSQVVLGCELIQMANNSLIAPGSNSQLALYVDSVDVSGSASAEIRTSVLRRDTNPAFQIGTGGTLRIAATNTGLHATSDGSIGGGGTLRILGPTAVGSLTVLENSTLMLDGNPAGSASTDVFLGALATPGKLAGRGTAKNIICNVANSSVSPGTPENPYGVITCDGIGSANTLYAVNLQVSGPVPGTSHDQIIVHNIIDYANQGGNLTFTLGFAPPSDTIITLIAPDPGATIQNPTATSQFDFLGQRFESSFLGGDGNDRIIRKLQVAAPLTGPESGLPAAFIQPASPPALPVYTIPASGEIGLEYFLEYSTTLAGWTRSPTPYAPAANGQFTATFPISPSVTPKLFFRLVPK